MPILVKFDPEEWDLGISRYKLFQTDLNISEIHLRNRTYDIPVAFFEDVVLPTYSELVLVGVGLSLDILGHVHLITEVAHTMSPSEV